MYQKCGSLFSESRRELGRVPCTEWSLALKNKLCQNAIELELL